MRQSQIENIYIVQRISRGKPKKFEDWKPYIITLPTVSFLNSDIELEPADYYAGRAAQSAAGY